MPKFQVPAFQRGELALELWNRGTLEPRLGSRLEIVVQGDGSSRLHVNVHLEVLEAGHADFDLVSAALQPQLLERSIEIIDQTGVMAVDEHLRIARTDP